MPAADIQKNSADTFLADLKNLPLKFVSQFDSGKLKDKFKKSLSGNIPSTKDLNPTEIVKLKLPVVSMNEMFESGQFVKLNGGAITYNYNYRSNVDTPFAEKNLQQHNSYGNISLSVAGLPFNINYLVRRSNSDYFQDINDVQVQFDAMQFRSNLLGKYNQLLQKSIDIQQDSLANFNLNKYLDSYRGLNSWLNDPFTLQKLSEYKELMAVPQISYTPGLPDSVNQKKAAEVSASADAFVKQYYTRKKEAGLLKHAIDSVKQSYKIITDAFDKEKKRINAFTSQRGNNIRYNGSDSIIPAKYRWLFNIKKFGLGRNQLNYSELTSKNMSLTGVNFEYNSWYYAAFAAGTVDYRFRDFAVNSTRRIPQYMTLVRLGIGQLAGSHLITSFYRGRKQLYAISGGIKGLSAIDISGLSLEGKWRFSQNHFIVVEGAQSVAPDFRTDPVTNGKFSFKDKSNKALSVKYHLYVPKTFSRLEGAYKFTGANFQSFSSFQTNAEIISWSIKADQYILKRKIKVALAVKKNEFSNPYLTQAYSNNTIFKSIQLTYRHRKHPVISAGYAPISQVTVVDSQLIENMFYTLNASVSHNYKIGIRKASSSFIYNKFFNNQKDTSFLYYQAENFFFSQSISFSSYVMNLSVSHSNNPSFKLSVIDAGIIFNAFKNGAIGFGVKVNEFSEANTKTGLYGSIRLNIRRLGSLAMQYNNGFIPGRNSQLVSNEIMNVAFTRSF